jgi:uncharacterized protein
MPFGRGKLFRLSRAGTGSSYVFATMHVADPRITSLLPRLRAALTDSKIVVVETVETGAALRQAIVKDRDAWRRAINGARRSKSGSLA